MHHKIKNNDKMETITLNQSPNVTTDQNNNVEDRQNNNLESGKKNEKYSLRQRVQRSRRLNKKDDDTEDSGDGKGTTQVKEKPKQKAAPLSKYRRKTANARERTRMREINSAFESLRQSVPIVVAGVSSSQPTNEKLTKITTLRMAMKYIRILDDILNNKTMASDDLMMALMDTDPNGNHQNKLATESHPQIVPTVKSYSVKSNKINKNVNNSILTQNNHDYCKDIVNETRPTKSAKVSPKKATKTIVKQNKREVKKQQTKQKVLKKQLQLQETVYLDEICNNKNNSILHRSIKFDTSLSPPNDDSPAELGLMMLESDGESLQLSEPCFSPLELGLLLESDGESLHLSEPLSPMNQFDALNSFNDLLNTGFSSEPTALDMYWS